MTRLTVLQTLLYLPALDESLPSSSSYKRENYERKKKGKEE